MNTAYQEICSLAPVVPVSIPYMTLGNAHLVCYQGQSLLSSVCTHAADALDSGGGIE